MKDDEFLALHPLVRQMIRAGTRDKALTLNWAPLERDAYDRLGLRDLSPLAMKARMQIITEVLVAGERFISYSRRCAFYTESQRYYRPTFSRRAVLPAVDQLAAEGIIEHEKVPPGHRGFQSRFRATPDLLKELSAVQVQYKPLELIVLRDANGNPVDYQDNRETRAMRKRLIELNEALLSQQIGIGDRIVHEGDVLDNGGRAQAQLHRVFHRGDFNLGGRFYGAHWQNIPAKGGRDRITINGEPTAEVDYRAMHIRLLYQEAGKPMPDDPYDFAPRDQAKLALLIAINAPSHLGAVRALADALRGDNGITDRFKMADSLLKAAKARHSDIAWALASDAGVRLMRKDSELAERIMLETVHAIGIVPLAVHDSFIVPANQEGRLMETMESAISCGTSAQKNPCGTTPHFGDKLSPSNPSENPKNGSTIMEWMGTDGRDGDGRGGDGAEVGVGGRSEPDRSGELLGLTGLVPPDVPQPTPAEPAERTNGAQHQAAEPAKPWSTPTVEEVSVESLPTELRMLVLGLPDAVADAPHQVEPQPQPDPVLVMQDSKEDAGSPPAKQPDTEKAPLVADVSDEADQAKQEIAQLISAPPVSVTGRPAETANDCVVCGGDLYRCFPLKCPLKGSTDPRGSSREPVDWATL